MALIKMHQQARACPCTAILTNWLCHCNKLQSESWNRINGQFGLHHFRLIEANVAHSNRTLSETHANLYVNLQLQ